MSENLNTECHGCGTELEATDSFCKACGSWQKDAKKTSNEESRYSLFEKNGWDRRYILKMILIGLVLIGGASLLVGLLIGHAASTLSG